MTSVSFDELPNVNRQEALDRLGGDESMLDEFLEMLLEQADALLPEMHEAIDNNDLARVEHLGHNIKGAAASLGAERVRYAAYAVELSGRAGDLAAAGKALALLEDQAALLRREMEARRP